MRYRRVKQLGDWKILANCVISAYVSDVASCAKICRKIHFTLKESEKGDLDIRAPVKLFSQ
jgi:hypothetical protein